MSQVIKRREDWPYWELLKICARILVFLLVISKSIWMAWADKVGEPIARIFPWLDSKSAALMTGYLDSLDFAECLQNPMGVLQKRLKWNREGHRFTRLLLKKLDGQLSVGPSPKNQTLRDSQRVIALLAGTHEDLAAVHLKSWLLRPLNKKLRFSIYAALAELGFYSDYYSGLLLKEVQKKRYESGDADAFDDCAVLLATIHQPEAVWAQDQLYEQRLVDGAVSEMVGPLLRLRDLHLNLRRSLFL